MKDITLPKGMNLKGGLYGSALRADGSINVRVPLVFVTQAAGNPSAAQGGIVAFDYNGMPPTSAGQAINTTITDERCRNGVEERSRAACRCARTRRVMPAS
ncbi:hypothetical protein [Burkholderia sp. AW49-1]